MFWWPVRTSIIHARNALTWKIWQPQGPELPLLGLTRLRITKEGVPLTLYDTKGAGVDG